MVLPKPCDRCFERIENPGRWQHLCKTCQEELRDLRTIKNRLKKSIFTAKELILQIKKKGGFVDDKLMKSIIDVKL